MSFFLIRLIFFSVWCFFFQILFVIMLDSCSYALYVSSVIKNCPRRFVALILVSFHYFFFLFSFSLFLISIAIICDCFSVDDDVIGENDREFDFVSFYLYY